MSLQCQQADKHERRINMKE